MKIRCLWIGASDFFNMLSLLRSQQLSSSVHAFHRRVYCRNLLVELLCGRFSVCSGLWLSQAVFCHKVVRRELCHDMVPFVWGFLLLWRLLCLARSLCPVFCSFHDSVFLNSFVTGTVLRTQDIYGESWAFAVISDRFLRQVIQRSFLRNSVM